MRVVLYASVSDLVLFKRVGFYRDDVNALRCAGHDVCVTNSIVVAITKNHDLFVGYFYSWSIVAAIFCRLLGRHVVLTGGADQVSPRLGSGLALGIRRGAAFLGLLSADKILLPCKDDVDNFRSMCLGVNFLQQKIVLSPHVVIPAAASANFERHEPRGFRAFTLCWLGTEGNVRRKGVDRAIKLIFLLRQIGVDATLDIAGTDGPGRSLVDRLVSEFGLSKVVQYVGAISEQEKNRKYMEPGVYLQLSEHEGFGVAAAEAFFSSMIVVHSNRGGLADVIGQKGLILNLEIIDSSDVIRIRAFYEQFLYYTVDREYLISELPKYSLERRASDLIGNMH